MLHNYQKMFNITRTVGSFCSRTVLSNSITKSDTPPISEVITVRGGRGVTTVTTRHVLREREFVLRVIKIDSRPSGGDADIRQRVERREAGHEVVQPRERDQVHGDLVQVHVEGSLETG